MTHEHSYEIALLQKKIELAIENSDFQQLATLSSKLEKIVLSLDEDEQYKASVTRQELDTLQSLLINVNKYQQETSLKFKDYTLKVSQKRKMHQAYKQ